MSECLRIVVVKAYEKGGHLLARAGVTSLNAERVQLAMPVQIP